MDYAVIEIGGSQLKVKKGDIVQADCRLGPPKKVLKINKVLMCHIGKKLECGNPYVKGGAVSCEVLGEIKADKVIVYKYKRRKSCKFKRGHRQKLTVLKVKDIKIE